MEFYISGSVHAESGFLSIVGRCGNEPVRPGVEFRAILREKPRRYPEGLELPREIEECKGVVVSGRVMAIKPVVRYMLLCDDWQLDPANNRRLTIVGLISNIRSIDDPPFPLYYREMCVFLGLTDGHGQGEGKIVCVHEASGQKVFETNPRTIAFGPDPLEVLGVPFRIRDITFRQAGLYSVQFWYAGELVEERPLRLR